MNLEQAVALYLEKKSTEGFAQVNQASLSDLSRFAICADWGLDVAHHFIRLIDTAQLPENDRLALLCLCRSVVVNRSPEGESTWRALSDYLALLGEDEFTLGDVPKVKRANQPPLPVVYPHVIGQVAKLASALRSLPDVKDGDWLEKTLRRLHLNGSEFGRNALAEARKSGRPLSSLLTAELTGEVGGA